MTKTVNCDNVRNILIEICNAPKDVNRLKVKDTVKAADTSTKLNTFLGDLIFPGHSINDMLGTTELSPVPISISGALEELNLLHDHTSYQYHEREQAVNLCKQGDSLPVIAESEAAPNEPLPSETQSLNDLCQDALMVYYDCIEPIIGSKTNDQTNIIVTDAGTEQLAEVTQAYGPNFVSNEGSAPSIFSLETLASSIEHSFPEATYLGQVGVEIAS